MRRLVIAAMFSGALAAAHAEPAPPLVSNERQGYAFEFPRVLAEQRLFGIAHGVQLLATACLDSPAEADAASEAYTRWLEQQHTLVDMLKDELAEFYFGPRAAEASWEHVAEVLKLRPALGLAPGSEQLKAACASCPEALQQPRYDLAALFQLESALASLATATRAEAHANACITRLPEAERPDLQARYNAWQAREAEALAAARTQMQLQWQNTATPGDPEAWLKAMQQRHAHPTDLACKELPQWLDSSASSLAQSFAPAPGVSPPVAKDEAAADNTVTAISTSQPEAVSATPEAAPVASATPVEVEPESAPNLFDYLMRLFDERPHEDAAKSSGKQPARSQRSHP